MSATTKVDVAVVGGGTAGLAAYRAALAAGARVVMLERGPFGTTCARVGCMPSKLLIAAAEAAHDAREAGPFGIHTTVRVDGRAVMERVRRERDRFVGFVTAGVDAIPEGHLRRGAPTFLAPGQLSVAGEVIDARAVVLATGSSPTVPSFFNPVRDRLVINDNVFDWTDLPSSVAVFGAGVIGLELGQALHRLGVRVRIFGRGGNVAGLTDPFVREAALRSFQGELHLDPDAIVHSIAPDGERGVRVVHEVDGRPVDERFDEVLVAAGRRPNWMGLGLEVAGIPLDAKGLPTFDRATLQVGASAVFLAGDVTDELTLLHEAADEGRAAGENAARFPAVRPVPRRSPLAIAFTDPQLAKVGESWRDLAGREDVVFGEVSFEDQGRSRIMLRNKGAARVYASRTTGRFLGAELAGPRVEHLGHLLAWAHQQGLTVEQMLAMPFYHPVIEEGIRTALRDVSAKMKRGV